MRLFFASLCLCITTHAAIDSNTVRRFQQIKYLQGDVVVGDKLATLHLGQAFKYVNPSDADFILSDLWGNPHETGNLGMIFPQEGGPFDSTGWAIVVEYSDDGHVKDDEAKTMDYQALLKEMQTQVQDANKERKENGFEPIDLVGWAEKPYYDEVHHKLFWAKELKFGDNTSHTLNYNIRVLGRKGYLLLNVVASMRAFPRVKNDMAEFMPVAEFLPGNQYQDFKVGMDKVAKYGIAGLVAGGVLAKVGFFKMLLVGLLALKKFLVIGVVALVAMVRKWLFGKNNSKKETADLDVSKKIE